MPTLDFFQLDVFADRPLTGNPLAVFPDARGLDDSTMQALAREMNLSETTFVLPSDRATRRIRFFTPTAEIPLAGHPTVGTWWLLAELGELAAGPGETIRVMQETAAGVLPVEIAMGETGPALVTMTQNAPVFGPVVGDTGALASALGGDRHLISGAPPPQVVSTAMPQLMVPIATLEALRGLPSGGRGAELARLLRKHDTDCAMCFARDPDGPDDTVQCRMFAPGLGVPEDPATGSAAGSLACYMLHHQLASASPGGLHLRIEQGREIGRPSQIAVEIRMDLDGSIDSVRVGGRAVTVVRGEVTV